MCLSDWQDQGNYQPANVADVVKEEDKRWEKTEKHLPEAHGNIQMRSGAIHFREVRELTFK